MINKWFFFVVMWSKFVLFVLVLLIVVILVLLLIRSFMIFKVVCLLKGLLCCFIFFVLFNIRSNGVKLLKVIVFGFVFLFKRIFVMFGCFNYVVIWRGDFEGFFVIFVLRNFLM